MRHLSLLLLAACTAAPSDDGLDSLVASDIEQTARVLEEVAAQPTTNEACYAGPGDCQACYSATGTAVSGTFELGMDATPCSADFSGSTYTVESSDFEGTWSTSLAGVTAAVSGDRSATFTSARGRVDNSLTVFTVDESSLTLDTSGAISEFALEADYSGLTGRDYQVSITGDGGSITGEASSPSLTCTIAGTVDAPEVSCAR